MASSAHGNSAKAATSSRWAISHDVDASGPLAMAATFGEKTSSAKNGRTNGNTANRRPHRPRATAPRRSRTEDRAMTILLVAEFDVGGWSHAACSVRMYYV